MEQSQPSKPECNKITATKLTWFNASSTQASRVSLGAEALIRNTIGVLSEAILVQRPLDITCFESLNEKVRGREHLLDCKQYGLLTRCR